MSLDYKVSYREKDGSIQAIISFKDNNGKWRQKSKQGFRIQKDAKPWIGDTIDDLKKAVKTPAEFRRMSFGKFKDIFLQDKKRYSKNTILTYKNAYEWFKGLNDILLIEVDYINIKPCIDKMIDSKQLGKTTIEKYIDCIATTLNHAKKNYKIIVVNPINKSQYEFPKEEKKKKINALNKSESDDILSKLDGRDYMISLIALKCGLRIGEIIGLQDASFNFEEAELKIDKQWKLIDENGEYGFGTLKSDNSYRKVPIPINYVYEIKNYVKNCAIGIDRRIFPEKKTNSTTSRLCYKYKRVGHDISAHDLRHTYATTLLANGLDYKTVAELMGDTVETIIKTYSHFIEDMYDNAKNKIDNIL